MSLQERQRQFEASVASFPGVSPDARIARNFGFSNSARVIEGGLFACTNNLESYSEKLAAGTGTPLTQFIFLCVLTFPPQDEVYFAIIVNAEADKVNQGLVKLYGEAIARNKEGQLAYDEAKRLYDEAVAAGKSPKKVKEFKPESISNNVKFYITADGRLYFHNTDFQETLRPEAGKSPLDEDCMARVDSVLFAIYPPSVSARRSLLARDFVGYLGSLVGRQKVHELIVWTDAETLSVSMRRMPAAIPVGEIEAAVTALGGHYPNGEVRRFHAALNFLDHKHFVILSGLSGTGKTQLALKYARAVHGLTNGAPDPLLFVCPVRPEWTDPTGLTGYNDVLTNRYVVPTFLAAVLVATAHRDSPIFVVLDEMNLARVEYYLSDVLSALETGSPLQLHSNDLPLEGTTGTGVRRELPLPSNLFIIGTINVDETTNPVSDKVLDRASVIDMSAVDVPGFLASLESRFSDLKAARAAAEPKLTEIHGLMQQHGLGFGYRVIEEMVRYHAFDAQHLKNPADDVTDQLLVQKVLVKLRGAEQQRGLLTALDKACAGLPRAQAYVRKLLTDLDEFGSFQAMR
jgi:5-methylcytosine-specific restriction protein B